MTFAWRNCQTRPLSAPSSFEQAARNCPNTSTTPICFATAAYRVSLSWFETRTKIEDSASCKASRVTPSGTTLISSNNAATACWMSSLNQWSTFGMLQRTGDLLAHAAVLIRSAAPSRSAGREAVFTRAIRQAIGFRSTPTEGSPRRCASVKVVPLPQNGSKTKVFAGIGRVSSSARGISPINFAGYGWMDSIACARARREKLQSILARRDSMDKLRPDTEESSQEPWWAGASAVCSRDFR